MLSCSNYWDDLSISIKYGTGIKEELLVSNLEISCYSDSKKGSPEEFRIIGSMSRNLDSSFDVGFFFSALETTCHKIAASHLLSLNMADTPTEFPVKVLPFCRGKKRDLESDPRAIYSK